MAKKKIKVSIEVKGFSVGDLERIFSNVEFLSRIETPHMLANSRQIWVQGENKLYGLNYRVTDYNVDEFEIVDLRSPETLVSDKNYTHAQVRDMRSAAKRKSK